MSDKVIHEHFTHAKEPELKVVIKENILKDVIRKQEDYLGETHRLATEVTSILDGG